MKIVILDGYTENPGDLNWEGFEKLGTLTVYEHTPKDEIISRIGDAELVITAELEGLKVSVIGDRAFYENDLIAEITTQLL